MKKYAFIMIAMSVVGMAVLFLAYINFYDRMYMAITGKGTIASALDLYGADARARLNPKFAALERKFPPDSIKLIALKDENMLEVWVEYGGKWKFLCEYPILAASGTVGPKLREGDRQVPEGLYDIESLNPNSKYHLSMKINYPNTFDTLHAKLENRINPGGDIFIHGKNASIGCLAMGDSAIEELFVLTAETGFRNVGVVIAPTDFRKKSITLPPASPPWLGELYETIRGEMLLFSSS